MIGTSVMKELKGPLPQANYQLFLVTRIDENIDIL